MRIREKPQMSNAVFTILACVLSAALGALSIFGYQAETCQEKIDAVLGPIEAAIETVYVEAYVVDGAAFKYQAKYDVSKRWRVSFEATPCDSSVNSRVYEVSEMPDYIWFLSKARSLVDFQCHTPFKRMRLVITTAVLPISLP